MLYPLASLSTVPRPARVGAAWVCSLLSAVLVGCGGAGDPEPAPTVVASASVDRPDSDLVAVAIPAAPTPGDVLLSDSAVLRPLADEALWVYRGVRIQQGQETTYSSFRQTTHTAQGVQERWSSPLPNASRTRLLQMLSQQLEVDETVPLANGQAAVRLRGIELRSPVRQGDQITLAEAQTVSLTEDLDADGKIDRAELAAWSRVAGLEDVELPELERSIRALRVDTHLVSRLVLSSKPQPEAASRIVESTWYAPRIGVIRSTRTQAATSGTGPIERDERLQFWDGISTGLGLLPSSPVSLSGTSAAIGPWLRPAQAAIRQGNQVMVLSNSATGGGSITLSVLDQRGRLIQSVEHTGLSTSSTAADLQLLPLLQGAAVAWREPGVLLGADQLENLKLARFDAQAQRQGKAVWLVDGALAGSLRSASDGQTVWVAWVDPGMGPQDRRLLLQAFDAAGDIRSRVFLLDAPGAASDIGGLAITARDGQVQVTWRVHTSQGTNWKTALGRSASMSTVTTLTTISSATADTAASLTPLLTDALAAVTWMRPLDRIQTVIAPRALALDAAGQVRRTTQGGLDQELLALPAGSLQATERTVLAAEGKAVLWAAAGTGRLRGDNDAPDRLISFAQVDAGDAALSAALPSVRRLRDTSPAHVGLSGIQALQHLVALDDRWMIIGHDGSRATVAILYKR